MQFKKLFLLTLCSIVTVSCNAGINSRPDSLNPVSAFSKKIRVDKPEVISIPSPNKNERPEGAGIHAIILHHTASAGDAKGVGNFFASPDSKVSAHYTVDRTGYIVQSVDDLERAWHAGKSEFNGISNVNDFSIGIEICNIGDSVELYPDPQYDAVIRLVAYLVKTYNVPMENITRHRDIAIPKGRKIDTSDTFSVQKVLDGVKKLLEGEYSPPPTEPPTPVNYPLFRTIKTGASEKTFKDIAEVYLDSEYRWNEIKYLNPKLNPENVPAGSNVKIPTGYQYFFQLKK